MSQGTPKLINDTVNIIIMSSRKKGQLEFIVIVALIIIAVAAVILVSRQAVVQPPPTTGIPEEAKTVKDSVTNLIRAGVKEKLALIYNQGGVLNPPQPPASAEFGAFDTAVWSACNETAVPDVAQQIGAGIMDYLRKNLKDKMEFFGKNVEFNFAKARSEVDIIKDRVNMRIYLPTKIDTYELEQPYEISVDTKLYDVLDYSRNFVKDATSSRFFEVVTIASMAHSNPESADWVPVAGIQTGCGNPLFKTRSQLLPGIKGIIRYTVSHVVWNALPPKLAENPFYPISGVGGKYYPDQQVAFAYPASWDSQLDKYFRFFPDPLRIIPKPTVPLVPLCLGPYSVAYTFRYPVIVMVEDSKLGQWFKFAMMVDIQNTQPGNCTAQLGNASDYARICVNEAKCDAKITVKDTAGNPVDGADASFYICDIGVTDSSGVVTGKIPCMVSELHVYKTGFRSYGDLLAPDAVADKAVTLKNITGNLTVHFKGLDTVAKLPATSDGAYTDYNVSGSPKDITGFGKELTVFLSFSPTDPDVFTNEDSALMITNYDTDGNLVAEALMPGLQPVRYVVTASLGRSINDENTTAVGYLNTTFELREGVSDVYVYLPAVLKDSDGNEIPGTGINDTEADRLTSKVITKCGSAVSDTALEC